MRRDMDLIRAILLDIEEKDTGNGYNGAPVLEGYSHEQVRYHCKIMDEAGLLNYKGFMGGDFLVSNMTWHGHEFLALSSNSEIWNKTKKTFLEKGIDFTFDVGIKLMSRFRDDLLSGII